MVLCFSGTNSLAMATDNLMVCFDGGFSKKEERGIIRAIKRKLDNHRSSGYSRPKRSKGGCRRCFSEIPLTLSSMFAFDYSVKLHMSTEIYYLRQEILCLAMA